MNLLEIQSILPPADSTERDPITHRFIGHAMAAGSKPLHLGLTVLDSSSLGLPRLRAATAEVIEILQLSDRPLYVLTED